MKPNVGAIDKYFRFGIAVIIAVLYFTHSISGTLAQVLGIVGIIMTLTALINFCPLYSIFGINTFPVKR